jgi:hypothetical protein
MSDRKVIFFLRHYNDIDHITPVIHEWLLKEQNAASVIITSEPDDVSDFRLQFLQDKYGIPIRWIGDYSSFPHGHLHRFAQWTERQGRYALRRLALRFWDQKISPISPLNHDTAARLLEVEAGSSSRVVLVFDWINSEKHLNPVRPVIEVARRMGIPVVSLPHGDSPYYNHLFYKKHVDYDFWTKFEHDAFDHIVVPNELTAQRYRPFRAAETLHVLGSPRYNRKWLEVLLPLIPPYVNLPAEGRRRVVLFLRNPTFPIFWDEVGKTLSLITQFHNLYLVVKQHTRQSVHALKHQINTGREPWISRKNIEFVSDEAHSSALIRWSDLVLDLGTSVVSEAVMLRKPALALEHLHANVSTLAHYIPKVATYCRDDLYKVMDRLDRGEALSDHYPKAERSRYILEMIEYPSPQVLERYGALLESLCEQPRRI